MWIGALFALALVTGGILGCRPRPPAAGRRPALDAAAAREVASRTNVALGLLENQALDECIPLLEELRQAVPDEPLPRRNLAVARADVVTRVDLDAPSLGAFNPVAGNVTFADAEITIGDAPGLGITAIAGLEPVSP